MIYEELSSKIIGAAMDVLNELRPGLDDPAPAGLRTRNDHRIEAPWPHTFDPKSISRFYRGELIGNLIPDLIVDDTVIVDPKVVACFTDTHVAQMLGYLNITGLDLALLLNFKNARLEWKRVLRPRELANTTHLTFMPEPYPCYPFDPWFVRAFDSSP